MCINPYMSSFQLWGRLQSRAPKSGGGGGRTLSVPCHWHSEKSFLPWALHRVVLLAMSTSFEAFETMSPQLQWGVFAHQCGDIMLPQVSLKPYQMRKGHPLYKWDFSSHCLGPPTYHPHWWWNVEGRGAIKVAVDRILGMQ